MGPYVRSENKRWLTVFEQFKFKTRLQSRSCRKLWTGIVFTGELNADYIYKSPQVFVLHWHGLNTPEQPRRLHSINDQDNFLGFEFAI